MALGAGRFAGFVALGSEAFFGFSLVVVLEVFNAESVLREEPLNLVESALQVKDSFAGLRHLALQAFLFVRGKARLAELRGGGILHAKFGIIYDDADHALVFRGSANETPQLHMRAATRLSP